MENLYAIAGAGRAPRSVAQGAKPVDLISEIEHVIGLVGAQRSLRLSLFRFEIAGISQAAAVMLVTRALKSQGLVGPLPDGNVGFLYLGPRLDRAVADLALVHHISERLRKEMQRQAPFTDVTLVSKSVVHRWADEVTDAYDLIEALDTQGLESRKAC
jgi:hypothetical protein